MMRIVKIFLSNSRENDYSAINATDILKDKISEMPEPLYPNQPLIEVATEIRFKGDLEIELIRSRFQSALRKEFPILKVPGAQQGVAPTLQPIRFERDDNSEGVQLAINSLSFYSNKYPGHTTYLEGIRRALGLFSEMINHISPTRVGWRYVNSIDFIREEGNLPIHRIFGDGSVLGPLVKNKFKDMSLKTVLPFGDNSLTVRLESGQRNGQEALLFDLDAFADNYPGESIQTISVIDKIQELHDLAYNYFEKSITDEYRLFLKGGDDE